MNQIPNPALREAVDILETMLHDLGDSIKETNTNFMAALAAKDGRIKYLEGEVARLEREVDQADARAASQR